MGEDAPTQKIAAPPPSAPPQRPRDATQPAVPTPAPPAVDGAPAPMVADPLAAASAGFAQRGKLRRQLRRLRAARADQLARLGTLILDARKRSNGSQPEVVTRRAAEVAEIDRQVRDLQHAVDPHADQRVVASGIAGSCRECGGLVTTEDRFCASCGTEIHPKRGGDAAAPPPPVPGTAEVPSTAEAPAATAPPPPPPPPPPGS